MKTFRKVNTDKSHFIRTIEFRRLKPRNLKRFKVSLWFFLHREIHTTLFFPDSHPGAGKYDLKFDPLPARLVPKFNLSSSCFKDQQGENDCGKIFTSAMQKIVVNSPTTRVIVFQRKGKTIVRLVIGSYTSEAWMNQEWANYLFKKE